MIDMECFVTNPSHIDLSAKKIKSGVPPYDVKLLCSLHLFLSNMIRFIRKFDEYH